MAKLSEKLKVCGILYRIGFSMQELSLLMDFKTPKQVISYIRKEKITSDFSEKQSLDTLEKLDFEYLENLGFLETIKGHFPELFKENSVKYSNISSSVSNILSSDMALDNENQCNGKITYESEVARYKALISEPDFNNVCSVCENKGFVYLPYKNGMVGVKSHTCPKCHGDSVNFKEHEYIEELEESILNEYVPNKKYSMFEFDAQTLERYAPIPEEVKDKIVFKDYISLLEEFLLNFKNGKLPLKSYLLTAPDSFGKKHFVYQAIKECLIYGYKPSKLLDILHLHNLFNTYKHDELEEILDVDILFIEITGTQKLFSPEIYQYILRYCERKGIPAIFISRVESVTIMQSKNKAVNVDWSDIFKPHTFDYDYGHLLNVGITGFSAVEIFKYKRNALEEFINMSPMKQKENTYFGGIEPVLGKESLYLGTNDFKKTIEETKTFRTEAEQKYNIEM